jgi:shikimate kinase
VADLAGTRFVDLDTVVESMRAARIEEVFQSLGEARFRVLEAQLLPIALQPGVVVALGGGTLSRHENVDYVRREGFGVWLDAPLTVLLPRISSSRQRPLAYGATGDELGSLLEERRPAYSVMHARVDASQPIDTVAGRVLELWTG